MTTAFDLLHRNVQRKLWDMNWTELRSIQDRAICHLLLGGGDAVIASPTASGKTEAAFLPVLSAIADSPTGSVRAMYIGPLKALINDQFRRVEDLCGRLEMPVCKWHGDVGDSSKQKLREDPGGVLLITPESLEAMLVRRPGTIQRLFGGLAFIVVDEMHAFMGTERGAQLISQIHRLNARAGCDPVRIGLSATLGDPDTALKWLRPRGAPATLIHDATATSAIQIRLRGIWHRPPLAATAADAFDPIFRELARAILLACSAKTNLVFANAKTRIELLADALLSEAADMKLTDEIVVHHGSLSRERRLHAEDRLRGARACTAVCSNTLELGIDIGQIDDVVQVSAPWSVASLVQRVGRSGRRDDAPRVLRGFFVEAVPNEDGDVWDRLHLDLVRGIATIDLMLAKFVEPPAVGRSHLSTLIHQCLAHLAETGGASAAALFQRVVGSGAFGNVSQGDFAATLRELGRHDLIEQMGDGSLILGLAGQKLVEHYTFFAAFNAPDELRVVHGGDEIGAISTPPAPGEHLVLAGRRWRVESIDVDRREVVVVPARGARQPLFTSTRGSVHPRVHSRMKELLVGTGTPAYADSVALEMLAAARAEATRHDGFRPRAMAVDGSVRLFVFGGSKVQETIFLVLAMAGVDAMDHGVGFDVDGGPSRVGVALRAFASNPDLARLAAHADQVLRRRELGKEKFEPFVAADVWRRAYAREELDRDGAASAALELADALTSRARVGGAPAATPDMSPKAGATAASPSVPHREVAGVPALAPRPPRNVVRPADLERLTDLCDAVAELPVHGPLPERLVVIPSEAHAHGVRRELVRGGRADLLAGLRLTTPLHLATDILCAAGMPFERGEELARRARLRALFRDGLTLRYFERTQLRDTPGWDRAFADTIGEMEAASLTPDLLRGVEDPRVRDVADVWAALDEAAGPSWTRARVVREAAQVLTADPAVFVNRGSTFFALSGHEARVDADLACAVPNAFIAAWAARPRRSRHVARLREILGAEVSASGCAAAAPTGVQELDLLKRFLFEDPSVTGEVDRLRSSGRDGSVELEQHDGVDAEIEAALTWVEREISERATPLEEIALLVPRLDPIAGILAERIHELDLPTYVLGGLPGAGTPVCSRLLALLRALSTFLHRDALVDLFSGVRVARTPRDHFTRGEALDAFGAVGFLGGNRVDPAAGLEWPARIGTRIVQLETAAARRRTGTESEEEGKRIERMLDLVRLIDGPMKSLTTAATGFVRGAPLVDLWPPLEAFLREHVVIYAGGARLLELFSSSMRSASAESVTSQLTGVDAHELLEETVLGLRLDSGRFGDPAITIATIESVAGIPFTAVRVLGLAEGIFPSTPGEDPVLPDGHRSALGLALRDGSDRISAQLHSLDRVVCDVRERIVFSSPKRDLEGTYREMSSVGIEAAIALGRTGVRIPTGVEIHRAAFEPAHHDLVVARRARPLRESTWHARAAAQHELPSRWLGTAHLDLERGRSLLDPMRHPDALDGIFPTGGWFPDVPGVAAARPLSASRWRTFLECPHRFLLEVMLGLRSPRGPLDESTLDALTYGTLFHTVAARFFTAHGEAFAKRRGPLDAFAAKAQEVADVALAECFAGYAPDGEAIRTAQRERLRRDVRALLEIDWNQGHDQVVAVELPFGTEAPLPLSAGAYAVYVRGYIDRIDMDRGEGALRDLKTGKSKPRKEGEFDPVIDAQLALYALVATSMRDAWHLPVSMSAGYVYPAGVRHTERSFQGAEYDLLEERGRTWLEMTMELASDRRFPRTARPADCVHCPFKPVCGPTAEARAGHVLEAAGDALVSFRNVRGQ